jgi:hypothetical protein
LVLNEHPDRLQACNRNLLKSEDEKLSVTEPDDDVLFRNYLECHTVHWWNRDDLSIRDRIAVDKLTAMGWYLSGLRASQFWKSLDNTNKIGILDIVHIAHDPDPRIPFGWITGRTLEDRNRMLALFPQLFWTPEYSEDEKRFIRSAMGIEPDDCLRLDERAMEMKPIDRSHHNAVN